MFLDLKLHVGFNMAHCSPTTFGASRGYTNNETVSPRNIHARQMCSYVLLLNVEMNCDEYPLNTSHKLKIALFVGKIRSMVLLQPQVFSIFV